MFFIDNENHWIDIKIKNPMSHSYLLFLLSTFQEAGMERIRSLAFLSASNQMGLLASSLVVGWGLACSNYQSQLCPIVNSNLHVYIDVWL